jgi:hypothetical protein
MIRWISILFVLVTVQTAPLAAQEKRPATELKALLDQAMSDASKGRFNEAISIWLMVNDELSGDARWAVHANLAMAYKQLKQYPEAWHHLNLYISNAGKPNPKAPGERKGIEKKLARTHLKTTVTCTPENTILTVGKAAHACPLTWWFKAGSHEIVVSKPGYNPKTSTITVSRKGKNEFAVTLKKIEIRYGHLEVKGDGKAVQVFLDGKLEGSVPFSRKLRTGDYELMVGKPGKMPWKKKITIEVGKTVVEKPAVAQKEKAVVVAKDPNPDKNPGKGNTITKPKEIRRKGHALEWALMGTGVALVVGGGVLNGIAASDEATLKKKHPANSGLDMTTYVINREEYNTAFNRDVQPKLIAGYVLYAAGTAAAGTGLTLLLVNMSDTKVSKDVSFAPLLAPHGGGVIMGVVW